LIFLYFSPERAFMRVVKNYMSYIEKQKAHHSSTTYWTREMLAFVFPSDRRVGILVGI